VHHTSLDGVQEGEPITASKFSINLHPAVVLFDSGSSHSFMSQEFMALNQGTKPIKEYLHQFNSLSRYCPKFVNTDALKIASFKRGLNLEMKKPVGTNSKPTFHAFISDCLTQESNNLGYATVENHKRAFASSQSQSRAPTGGHPPYRLPVSGAKFKPPQKRF
jgi:hypothetical protein